MTDQHVVVPKYTDLGLGINRFEVLKYPSLASAQAMFIDQSVIFQSAQDFEDRMTMFQMNTLLKVVLKNDYNKSDIPASKPRRAEYLWRVCLKYARPHNPRAKTHGKRAEKRADQRYRVSPLYLEDSTIAHQVVPPQVRAMQGYFVSHMSPDGVDEEGVELLVRQMHDQGLLVTKQDPVRIWRYYRAKMLSVCFLEEI